MIVESVAGLVELRMTMQYLGGNVGRMLGGENYVFEEGVRGGYLGNEGWTFVSCRL